MCVLNIFLDRLSRNDCLGPGSVIWIKSGGEECIRYCNHSDMLILKQRYRNFSGLYEGSCIRFQIVNFSWDAYDPIFRNVMSLLGKMQNQDTRSYCYCSLNLLCEFFSSMSASSRRYTLLPIICQELTFKRFEFSLSRRKRKNLYEDVKNKRMSYFSALQFMY